jgi:hypothetical protein
MNELERTTSKYLTAHGRFITLLAVGMAIFIAELAALILFSLML